MLSTYAICLSCLLMPFLAIFSHMPILAKKCGFDKTQATVRVIRENGTALTLNRGIETQGIDELPYRKKIMPRRQGRMQRQISHPPASRRPSRPDGRAAQRLARYSKRRSPERLRGSRVRSVSHVPVPTMALPAATAPAASMAVAAAVPAAAVPAVVAAAVVAAVATLAVHVLPLGESASPTGLCQGSLRSVPSELAYGHPSDPFRFRTPCDQGAHPLDPGTAQAPPAAFYCVRFAHYRNGRGQGQSP